MITANKSSNITWENYLTPSTRTIFRALLDDTVDDMHLLVTLPACCPIDDPFIGNRMLKEVELQSVNVDKRALSIYQLFVINLKWTNLKKLMNDFSFHVEVKNQSQIEFLFQQQLLQKENLGWDRTYDKYNIFWLVRTVHDIGLSTLLYSTEIFSFWRSRK